MEYIYESPDKGKTVYRRPIDQPDAKRELVVPNEVEIEGQKIVLYQPSISEKP